MKIALEIKGGTKIATVSDNDDYMEWAEITPGIYTKILAKVNNQHFRATPTWEKFGKGQTKTGAQNRLKILENYFRENINEIHTS